MNRADAVLFDLRQLLGSGRYPENTRLPPERSLCEELRVSRSTLRKALAILEAEGTIRRHVGQGTFIGTRAPAQKSELTLAFQACGPAQIFQARLILEPQIAALAAIQASPSDIRNMRYFVDKSATAHDFQAYERWDNTFHRALAEASHNSVCVTFIQVVRELRRHAEWGKPSRAALTLENQRVYSCQHEQIVIAIEERDQIKAADCMRAHLKTVERDMLALPQ